MSLRKLCAFSSAAFFCVSSTANAQGCSACQSYLEQVFATAIVLTDSDVFTVGVHDFDPNEWFNLDNEEIGSQDSVKLRQRLALSALPFSFDLSDENAVNKHQIFLRFSALGARQEYEIRPQDSYDFQHEYVLGAFTAYRYQYQLAPYIQLTPGIGLHLQYFKDYHEYRSDFSNSEVKPVLDGVLFNTDAWAATLDPHVELKYDKPKSWGSWNIASSFHYLTGRGWGNANYGDVGSPEGWYMANSIEAYYNVSRWGPSLQSVYASFRRIDIGGDTRQQLGASHYYEGAIGWLLTPPFESKWIDNIGIGLNLNYGSSLKGGSIVLFFNQAS